MRELFDLDPTIIYLNSGTHSICPKSVCDAVTAYQRCYERNPTEGFIQAWGRLWKVQKSLAAFFCADPHDLFLRPNITAVLNDVILGMPLPPASEIVVTNLEYGATVNICRFRAERDHVKLRTVQLPMAPEVQSGMSEKDWVDFFASQIRPETGMLLLSHINCVNGLILPIAEIAVMTREKGVLLVVDGAHGPGSIPLDFRKLEAVHFYGGNLHKWMMGPKGTAFGWVSKKCQKLLRPLCAGWTTFEATPPFSEFGENNPFQLKMLMRGCHDFAPFFALEDMRAFWEAQKPGRIHKRLAELQDTLRGEMERKGMRLLSPARNACGPLLTYEMSSGCQRLGYSLVRTLLERYGLQITVAHVEGRFAFRLSPHIYNTDDEMVRAAAILAEFASVATT